MSTSAAPAASSTSSQTIPATALSRDSFRLFGHVLENPATHSGAAGLEHTSANQGTATKWLDVSHLENWYSLAPSRKPARGVVNMFVCRPRELEDRDGASKLFTVRVLERHPFTPQTFVPLGVAANDKDARYLVIVAPTLPSVSRSAYDERSKPYPAEKPRPKKKSLKERLMGARPNPFTNDFTPTTTPPSTSPQHLDASRRPKGPGEPDLGNLQAFIARGDQAVTYGPGTWHAPMVVLGGKEIDFVVIQYANGVGVEDCQEVYVEQHVAVAVDESALKADGAGYMRAKL